MSLLPMSSWQLGHRLLKPGDSIASVTCFYQLQAGDYTETKKMVILK